MAIRVFHKDRPDVMLPLIAKDARLVVWPGVGAMTANLNYVQMEPGEANLPHAHAESEDTIFILAGAGSVEDFDNGAVLEFHANQAIHVPIGVKHAVKANRGVEVVSAFQNVSAHRLQHLESPVECDVIVSGTKPARERVMALCELIPGLRGIDGGPLANARIVEDITALLIGLNIRYRVPEGLGLRLTGLPERPTGS